MQQASRTNEALAREVVKTLTARGETLACCESLTAGLLAATVASVPGASAILRGGLITYATDLKATLAGVDADVLDRFGPVSAPVALQMARGARERCGATWGVALTGVAGPDPQDDHPVGEVHVAVSGPTRTAATVAAEVADTRSTRFTLIDGRPPLRVLIGDRQFIREQSVNAALSAVLREIG
ncbi:CinA family protein [Corynebacterium aquatimens]|uniref:Nicotinamide-nucleotide amidase n=1 Tax=Corynebacterium aquatimens TaxID=1190508 RepID=A0A931DWZ5_9CORY|nr:CinA family protein [Corynebacterium aquatimens]MBG6121817.1 nicotinamide-nucleotide amidase [Corynebacterium aquatimens]WJY65645.1 Putative competence-damage inducible protein [Corynebacterium aquatimens]